MGPSRHKLKFEDRDWLVECLLKCDKTEEFWRYVIVDFTEEIGAGYRYGATIKQQVDSLVSKSLEFPDGIETMLSRVRSRTDVSLPWRDLAKAAFRLLGDLPPDTEESADCLIDLVEEIDPDRTVVDRLCKTLSIKPPKDRSFTNAFDVLLVLFRQNRPLALRFIQELADAEGSDDRSGDLRAWLEDAAGTLASPPSQS